MRIWWLLSWLNKFLSFIEAEGFFMFSVQHHWTLFRESLSSVTASYILSQKWLSIMFSSHVTYITNCMEQNYVWEAKNFWGSYEISRIVWKSPSKILYSWFLRFCKKKLMIVFDRKMWHTNVTNIALDGLIWIYVNLPIKL